MTEKENREDKTVRQFILFCRTALKYEKLNYYNEQKYRAERENHIDILTARCLVCRAGFLIHAMLIIFQLWDMKSA